MNILASELANGLVTNWDVEADIQVGRIYYYSKEKYIDPTPQKTTFIVFRDNVKHKYANPAHLYALLVQMVKIQTFDPKDTLIESDFGFVHDCSFGTR